MELTIEMVLEIMVLDVLQDTDHDLDDATEEELAEIKRRQEVYRERLFQSTHCKMRSMTNEGNSHTRPHFTR